MIWDGIDYPEVIDVSDIKVCKSAAGYYIGHLAKVTYSDSELPFSGHSGYFKIESDARKYLESGRLSVLDQTNLVLIQYLDFILHQYCSVSKQKSHYQEWLFRSN